MEVAESSAVRLRVLLSVKGIEMAALAGRWVEVQGEHGPGTGPCYAWVPAATWVHTKGHSAPL